MQVLHCHSWTIDDDAKQILFFKIYIIKSIYQFFLLPSTKKCSIVDHSEVSDHSIASLAFFVLTASVNLLMTPLKLVKFNNNNKRFIYLLLNLLFDLSLKISINENWTWLLENDISEIASYNF